MNIKYFILTWLMAGIILFPFGMPSVHAQTGETPSNEPAASEEPVMGPSQPAESTAAPTMFIVQPSEEPSPSPEVSTLPEATPETQPVQSTEPSPTIQPFTAPPAVVVPSPSPYIPPQANTGFFSWKGFFNLDSFFDKFWGTRFQSSLDGSQEVGEYGDPDGAGKVMLETYPSGNKMCVVLKTTGLDQLTGVAIHWGPFGIEEEPVVSLPMIIAGGVGSGCAVVDSELLKDIRKNPFNYYVNVSTSAYQNGAIRGQLSRQ